ncbi:MAG: zinc-dependent metalloprotease [Chitinophagales bacterium]|nr:zinc-dependent metalloprotease [Chitinophagales bacterium]MCZ2394162.1 zinc-dependent metalloprotease [Chitinophagales bacterium]
MKNYLLIFLAFFTFQFSFGKSKKKEAIAADTLKTENVKSNFKPIKELTEKLRKSEGLFPLYQDSITGKTYLEINSSQLNKEFIYFMYVLDGVVDAGYFRGAYRDNIVLTFSQVFDRIEIKAQNTSFYFDPNSELSKAKDANINQPILASELIQALTVDTLDSLGNTSTRFLIEADGIFLSESLSQIKPSPSPTPSPSSFSLGSLTPKKTKYLRLQNYPQNTDIEVEYVYSNASPVNEGDQEVTDARNVSVKVRHSIIEMPQNNYRIRYDDPRVGYFLNQSTELTSTSVTPYKDKIKRWHLVKKDSTLLISEPIEPITFWIENTTPLALRPIIKDAVERWNIAFETAGFKNAIVCNIQPDTASWDAGDIRYNVIRWTSSPNPPFGGYGPSFSNPRTGQLIGADIMLEWIYLSNRVKQAKIFSLSGLASGDEANNSWAHSKRDTYCNAGMHLGENLSYGNTIMEVYNFDHIQKDTFMTQCLIELVLHEVGHTLGLNHNFAGSFNASNEQWQNKNYGETIGISSSVMDYNIANISPDKNHQGSYFTIVPGLYDRWAIQYGYSQFSPEQEKEGLQTILSKSNNRENLFFNDADDMRSPGKGTDPRAMLYDMTSDPLSYAEGQIILNNKTFGLLKAKYIKENQSYQELKNAYLILSSRNSSNFTVLSRWIGGVYVNRNFAGQDTIVPFVPVQLNEQKRAMDMLAKYAFSPNAFDSESELYNYLQSQRRGYEFYGSSELPSIHQRILNIQSLILKQILHKNTLDKIVDTKLYGNQYDINTMLSDLTQAIVKGDISGNVNTIRQQLQVNYVDMLIQILKSSDFSQVAKSAVLVEVQKIKRMAANGVGDASSKAHKEFIIYQINKFLEGK